MVVVVFVMIKSVSLISGLLQEGKKGGKFATTTTKTSLDSNQPTQKDTFVDFKRVV